MTDPRAFPPAAQKLNPAGVAAIPPAASTPPPLPPSGRSASWAIGHRGPDIELPSGCAIEGVNRHAAEHAQETRRPVKIYHRCPGGNWTEIREINPWKAPEPAQQLADTLKAVAANLDGHIARHAATVAAPHIAASAAEVAAARHETEMAERRHADLVAEFRRQIAALEKARDRYAAMLTEHGIDHRTGLKVSGT